MFISQLSANALADENLYDKETATRYASEGDVVRSAALFIFYPLNHAFAAHLATIGTVTCIAELSSNRLRADITYFKNTQFGNKKTSFCRRGV